MNFDVLKEYGIDYEEGLSRCMGDEDLYGTVLDYYLNDTIMERAETAFKNKDHKQLFEVMHELKGSCGNASIIELYGAVCKLVDLLRYDEGTDEEIASYYEQVKLLDARAKTGIDLAKNNLLKQKN